MKKRWIALVLALLFSTMLSASAQAQLPDGFTVEELLRLYNEQLMQTFISIDRTGAATKVAQYKSGSAQLEDGTLSLANRDGTVTIRASFPDAVPDTSVPAERVEMVIASGVDPLDLPALRTVLANVIAGADGEADPQALLDWMNSAAKGGEALALNGYSLAYDRDAAGTTYALLTEGAGVGDGQPEAKPDGIPDPGPVAEPEPPAGADATRAPVAEAGALLSWKGFEVTPLRTERWLFSSGQPSLRVYVRVVNDSQSKLTMRVDDMTVDGTALPATSLFDIRPGTDTGADSETSILVYPEEDLTEQVIQSVVYGREMSMRLTLVDTKNYEDVYMEKVSLDLSTLPGETTVMEPSGEPTPAATRAPAATKAPAATARPSYQPLFEGDKGEDVKRMQRRLIELGYLNDSADGEFGPRTAAAVREFCQTNGLGSDSYASSAMLERLYSGNATPYQEPWVPLVFQEEARGEWRNAKGGGLSFRAKVTNTSRARTVRAFEFYLYATDVWGDRLYSDSIYYGTTTRTIKPGQSAFSDYFVLPNRSQISKVWCGIKKVIFSDGTIRENDTVDYASWTIK